MLDKTFPHLFVYSTMCTFPLLFLSIAKIKLLLTIQRLSIPRTAEHPRLLFLIKNQESNYSSPDFI